MAQGFELIFEDLVEMNEDKKNKIRNLFLYKDLLLITKKDTKKNKYAICEYINLLSSKFSFSSEESKRKFLFKNKICLFFFLN